MSNEISILDPNPSIDLETNSADRVSLAIKSISGAIPLGGVLGEIISSIIPNQKMDRVVQMLDLLNFKLSNTDRRIEESELKSEEFTDLLEQAMHQASRALSADRIEYIANFLKNSLTKDQVDSIGKKKLLTLLGELNDIEIIWLKSYTFFIRQVGIEPYNTYYEKHIEILRPLPPRAFNQAPTPMDGTEELEGKRALRSGYLSTLSRLGLIEERFPSVKDGEVPKFDEKTGGMKSKNTNSTGLGRLLIEFIESESLDSTISE